MDYSPDALDALLEEVEHQGGALLPEPCMPEDIEFTKPPYEKASKQRGVTCGCGHETRVVMIYDPQTETRKGGGGFCTACAVCDSVGAMPRFINVVLAADPDLDLGLNEESDE